MKRVYSVAVIKRSHELEIKGRFGSKVKKQVPLTWTDGMIGVMPLFSSYEAAKKYCGDRYEIFEYEI